MGAACIEEEVGVGQSPAEAELLVSPCVTFHFMCLPPAGLLSCFLETSAISECSERAPPRSSMSAVKLDSP